MIKVDKIEIKGIGPIDEIEIEFNSLFNIICGQNGVGKTTIIECIGQSFSMNNRHTIKRNYNYDEGEWEITINKDAVQETKKIKTKSFLPTENTSNSHGFYVEAKNVIVFKTQRSFNYMNLTAIQKDPERNRDQMAAQASSGTISNDIKQWFVHRYLWSAHDGVLSSEQKSNFELAIKSFSLLNESVSFSRIDSNTNDIFISTPTGEIYFEYLSSGYKSCLAVLLGLIKEIEFRNKSPFLKVKEFDGLVIIDEIDLHLHPEWQVKIYYALKEILPVAQKITTSHSPHIIQVAEPNEIIPLILDNSGKISINEVKDSEFGFQGWTIEEILTDVMGMKTIRSEDYLKLMSEFSGYLDEENHEKAKEIFDILDKMLHPQSTIRKITKIQLDGIQQ